MNPLPTDLDQFDALLLEKQTHIDTLKEELRGLRRERDKIAARASAKEKLSKLSDAERDALRQEISDAGGRASTSVVGTPGN